VLCRSVGVDLADVEQILIGGAFGQYINVEKADPHRPAARPAGRALPLPRQHQRPGRLHGLLCVNVRHDVLDVAAKMTYLELSADNSFMDEYTSALFLPHTDLDTFPSVGRDGARARRGAAHAADDPHPDTRRRHDLMTIDHRHRRQGRHRQDHAGRPAHPPAGGRQGRPHPGHRRRPGQQPQHGARPAAREDRRRHPRGHQREGARQPARAGVAKRDLLDYEINASVVEGVGVDLLAMGRPEGPGCYCAANNMLRAIVDRIADSYPGW
jgi:hypothetical protein